jgi:hypothetical protein
MAAEHNLRQATGRVMGTVTAPAGLRDRIMAAVEADRNGEAAVQDVQAASIASADGRDTRDQATWTNASGEKARTSKDTRDGGDRYLPSWMGFAAAAAVLLAATLYFTSLFGQGGAIDSQFRFNLAQASYITETHTRACTKTADVVADFEWTDETTVMNDISAFIGSTLCIGRLPGTQGCTLPVNFAGAGDCNLPGTDKAMHVLMRFAGSAEAVNVPNSASSAESTTASLFISQAPGADSFDAFDSEVTYRMDGAKYGCEGFEILMWEVNGVRYHLATRNEARELAEMILAGFGRPAPSKVF